MPSIAIHRLYSQQLVRPQFDQVCDVVGWFGAVQSQDYGAAAWSLGQRTPGASAADVDEALNSGVILRTHVLRPTWHFVLPQDIRWMLALTGPRVIAGLAARYRELELDEQTFARSQGVFENALQGGKQLTREELGAVLEREGISAAGQRLPHLLMHAEMNGLLCSGAKRGKQHTFTLLEERVAPVPALEREPALAELARRYFTAHGPATLKDFVWWSGLTTADARTGLELARPGLQYVMSGGQQFWYAGSIPPPVDRFQTARLLPNYDEYMVGYVDKSASFDARYADKLGGRGSPLGYIMVIDGQVVGSWSRSLKARSVALTLQPFKPLTGAESAAFADQARRYGEFLRLDAEIRA